MKNPKNLKRRHKEMLIGFGLNPKDFYVVKEVPKTKEKDAHIVFVDKFNLNELRIPIIK